MKLGVLGRQRSEEARRAETDAELRRARVEAARRTQAWTEVADFELVDRGRDLLVHSETDEVFRPARGAQFAPGSASVIADRSQLTYYVDEDGELRFLERVPGVTTWSDYISRKAAKDRRRAEKRERPKWMDPDWQPDA